MRHTDHVYFPAYGMADFDVSLATYAGDLFVQLDAEMQGVFDGAWKPLRIGKESADGIEYIPRYVLSPSNCRAVSCTVESDYLALLGERGTFRFINSDKRLPRAVIFRDSTADYLVGPLAQHFSESLFVWHKGQVYSDIIEREKPDVVLHLIAERFMNQYTNFPPFAKLDVRKS